MATDKKLPHSLYLLDGMALVYRAYLALIRSPIYNSKGTNTSALFGFVNTLVDLLVKRSPTHIAVVFDTSAPTPRHHLFPAYKAQRQEMPEDLAAAIPHVKRLVRAFNIPALELDGFEADDIIGTLAARADARGDMLTYMVTPDKDFAQLVSPTTIIYKPGRQGGEVELLDLPSILSNWGIERPDQVIDILVLLGDASDNIPCIPGIGENTAKKLVGQFGSVEGLLENVGQLKGKQKENVEKFGQQAILSKQLATIIRDVPIPVTFEELAIEPMDEATVMGIFTEFEFNAIGKRLFGESFKAGRGALVSASPASPAHAGASAEQGELFAGLLSLADVPHQYTTVASIEAAHDLVARLGKQEAFCFDVETTSLDPRDCEILGVAFSFNAHEGFYADCTVPGMLETLAPALEQSGAEKVGHNLKFDLGVLLDHGVVPAGPFFDTMLVHSLCEPDQRHGMDYLSERLLGYTPVPIDSLIGSKKDKGGQLSMSALTGEKLGALAEYAAEDADVTWQLAARLRTMLEDSGQAKVYYEIEGPLLPVLVAVEHEGIALDVRALAEIGAGLEKRMAELQEKVIRAAGTQFNLNSPKQLGQILFDVLKLVEKPKKTKTGQYKTDEQTLATLSTEHAIVRDLLEHRESSKLKSTYVDALPTAVARKSGRVHTTFHQLMTATGRLASSNPNLQNIPVRTQQGREIRKAFVPGRQGCVLLSADYSQIELRVMASISGDPAMVEAFENGLDIHTATAAKVYGVGIHDVLPEMRRTAKMVNFGIIYGISAFGLSQRLGIPRSEAAGIISAYFREYAGVRKFMDEIVERAKRDGFVETLTGRRRYLRDINSTNGMIRSAAERTAINTPIQGSSADMIKLAMIKVEALLREQSLQTRMLLQVHDELVFEMPEAESPIVIPLVEETMRDALPLKVPVVVESGTGANWLEAH
ncbi:DNA polymerase I [soil metagenome]